MHTFSTPGNNLVRTDIFDRSDFEEKSEIFEREFYKNNFSK